MKMSDSYYAEEDLQKLLNPNALPAEVAGLQTTSAKIRALTARGYTRGAIAKLLKIRYQHVRNVQLQPLKK
jgi:hypothetical protein